MVLELPPEFPMHNALAGLDPTDNKGYADSRPKVFMRRFLHWTEHPTLHVDPTEALRVNEQLNLTLVDTIEAAHRPPAVHPWGRAA